MKIKSVPFKFVFIIFYYLSCSIPISAQIFGEADLERLIMKHPMMKNYDKKTGHFKNTPHELRNVQDLKNENASLTLELNNIELEEIKRAKGSLEADIQNEDSFWNDVVSDSNRKQLLANKIRDNKELIERNGNPGFSKLYPIIDDMCNDIFVSLYDEKKVILNKLPRYLLNKPDLEGKDFRQFWNKPSSVILENYLKHSYYISQMFPSVDKTILFQKVGEYK